MRGPSHRRGEVAGEEDRVFSKGCWASEVAGGNRMVVHDWDADHPEG